MIRVTFGDSQIDRSFSYSPADTISQLAEVVDAVVASGGQKTVVFHGGPDELELTFDRRDMADGVLLTITAFESRSRDRGGDVSLEVRTSPQLLGKVFWRALRELEGAMSPQDYAAEWRHPLREALGPFNAEWPAAEPVQIGYDSAQRCFHAGQDGFNA